ncbi:SUN domain-containing protein 3 [Porphyridium purpureum]|uniref:SUN domain-containing protein 3 n=1 Tax=Porphyridium purpureum TaxID=35688 RepID=A0A5J4Z715_PORPP|nr:SUN domain-containing protein 3 [Porphyridium purpureum]|eukprot:POR3432..scf295_1
MSTSRRSKGRRGGTASATPAADAAPHVPGGDRHDDSADDAENMNSWARRSMHNTPARKGAQHGARDLMMSDDEHADARGGTNPGDAAGSLSAQRDSIMARLRHEISNALSPRRTRSKSAAATPLQQAVERLPNHMGEGAASPGADDLLFSPRSPHRRESGRFAALLSPRPATGVPYVVPVWALLLVGLVAAVLFFYLFLPYARSKVPPEFAHAAKQTAQKPFVLAEQAASRSVARVQAWSASASRKTRNIMKAQFTKLEPLHQWVSAKSSALLARLGMDEASLAEWARERAIVNAVKAKQREARAQLRLRETAANKARYAAKHAEREKRKQMELSKRTERKEKSRARRAEFYRQAKVTMDIMVERAEQRLARLRPSLPRPSLGSMSQSLKQKARAVTLPRLQSPLPWLRSQSAKLSSNVRMFAVRMANSANARAVAFFRFPMDLIVQMQDSLYERLSDLFIALYEGSFGRAGETLRAKRKSFVFDDLKFSEFENRVRELVEREARNAVASEYKVYADQQDAVSRLASARRIRDFENVAERVLERFSADKGTRPDYALLSAGAYVLSSEPSRATQLADFARNRLNTFIQNSGYRVPVPKAPSTALQPDTSPGNCWAFVGAQATLKIHLARPVVVDEVTIDHAAYHSTFSVSSAPKHFQVVILLLDGTRLFGGDFEFHAGPFFSSTQHFSIKGSTAKDAGPPGVQQAARAVELKVLSNHGNEAYTCLYRFRVHGREVTF